MVRAGSVAFRPAMSDRHDELRRVFQPLIAQLSERHARRALLQALIDLEDHWDAEHGDEPPPAELGIPADEYLRKLIERTAETA